MGAWRIVEFQDSLDYIESPYLKNKTIKWHMIRAAVKNSRLCQLAVKEMSEVLQKAALELLYCINVAPPSTPVTGFNLSLRTLAPCLP